MKRWLLGLAMALLPAAAFAAPPPAAWTQNSAGGTAIYDDAGNVVGYANPLPVDEASFSYKDIATAATTAVKAAPGYLHTITVNTFVASATITVYDSATGSGTKIATITLPATITADAPFTLKYDAAFATALTIVTSGATDVTVSYR